MEIVFDLDGTLIDSSKRMFLLFKDLIKDCSWSYEEYWYLKRTKHNHRYLIDKYFCNYDYNSFNDIWMSRIEERELLEYDCLYSDTINVLDELSKDNSLFLLTARQRKDNLLWQLQKLGILRFFESIYLTENKTSKDSLIKEIQKKMGKKNQVFVSDMGQDIAIGNMNGCITIAASYGFMDMVHLKEYTPQFFISCLHEILPIIQDQNKTGI